MRLGVGHGIARSLGRLGVAVYGVHSDLSAAAARSRYWRRNFEWDFSAPPEATVARLLEIARTVGGRPLLIPANDSTCLLVDRHAGALRTAYRFPEQPPGLVPSLSSKRSMHDLCRSLGVPTPPTLFPTSSADVLNWAPSLHYPVMLKGIDTFALYLKTGVRMEAVATADELVRRYNALESPDEPNLMIQEHIPGGSESVWMFDGYFDADSRCRFGLTGQKLRQYPADKGVTSLGVCAHNDVVHRHTVELMGRLGYRGILDIGYKRHPTTGEYLLLDVNPRIGVSFRLFVDRAGVDVARALYLDMTGQPVPTGERPEGRKWLVENFDAVTAAGYWRAGRLTLRDWVRSLSGVEEASWTALDDPLPAIKVATASAGWMLRAGISPIERRLRRARPEQPAAVAARG